MGARPHFLERRCTGGWDRLPIATSVFLVAAVACFYSLEVATQVDDLAYERESPPWYTAWAYAFGHLSASHLWSNMVIFALGGALFEATEGNARLVVVIGASTPIAALGHGVFSGRRVLGASGYVYATLTYQIALLLKNWREMRARPHHEDGWIACRSVASSAPMRLTIALILFIAEIVSSQYTSNVSNGGHLFGALAGIFLGVTVGSNVVIDACELCCPLVGLVGYLALAIVGFATRQYAAGALALVPLPVAIAIAVGEIRAWLRAWKFVVRGTALVLTRRTTGSVA